MFNAIKFFLTIVMIFTSTLSIAGNCTKSCYEEARPYVDKSVFAEKMNTSTLCQMRCANMCFTEGSIAEIVQSFKGKPDDYAANVCTGKMKADTAQIKENTARRKEQKALEKEKREVSARKEYEASKRNYEDAVRNPPPAQASTQTQQNNYPSDSTYEQSVSNSSPSSSSGRETTLAINHCASVTRDKYEAQIFKNVCNIPISLYWCVESECTSNNGRLIRMKPGNTYNVMAGEGKQFYFIACPQPYLPNERPNGVFDGNSATCEK